MRAKGRRKKVRYIQQMPKTVQFSPRGNPGRPDEVELKIDQYEAIKLADFQGYNQSEGAKLLGLSRASFGRILREARKVLADALVNAKTIRIRTSDVQVGLRREIIPKKKDVSEAELSELSIREKLLSYKLKNKQL